MKELRNCPYCNAKATYEQFDTFCMITCSNYMADKCYNQPFTCELAEREYMTICWNERAGDVVKEYRPSRRIERY